MRTIPRASAVCIAVLALFPRLVHADEENGLRSSVAPAADANGDGIPDLAVAARRAAPQVDVDLPGRVWILDPRTGALLRTIEAPSGCRTFGAVLADVGDVDGDGATDLAVSAGSRVRVHSGKTGGLLHELAPGPDDRSVVLSLSGGHDVDGDGRPDVALFRAAKKGWAWEAAWPEVFGTVEIHSGKTGELLRAIGGPDVGRSARGPNPGRLDAGRPNGAIALVPDRDENGRAELVLTLAAGEADETTRLRSMLHVVDPWTLASFKRHALPELGVARPWLVREIDDLDGDAAPDFVLSVIEDYTVAISGAVGSVLHVHSYQGGYLYGEGSSLDVVGDVNDDGVPDYLVAANEDSLDCDPGFVTVHSGADGSALRSLRFEYGQGVQGHGVGTQCGPGADACAIDDVDGDGKRDVAVHIPRMNQVRILSGATFEEIVRVDTPTSEDAVETSPR